ncbi:glycoside hydrolase family protein [Spirochaetia bacterium]|nr:glycoside hydrolase family protein [Spirochaetia bacterium]
MNKPCFSLIIVGHHPFVSSLDTEVSGEEQDFFETLSETWLPLADLCLTLEEEGIPFRFGMVLSPSLSAMFKNAALMEKYLLWLDKRIAFGEREQQRNANDHHLLSLAKWYYHKDCRRRTVLTDILCLDLAGFFEGLYQRGHLEFLLTAATNAFLPFYVSSGEVIRAQIETAMIHHRKYFGKVPMGFWLPGMGWTPELDTYLHNYNFAYTIAAAHGLALGDPPAERGSFFPVKTPSGLTVFANDVTAPQDLEKLQTARSGLFQCRRLDAGFELPSRALKDLLRPKSCRCSTGYRYWTGGSKKEQQPYDPQAAEAAAAEAAALFLDQRFAKLEEAQMFMNESGDLPEAAAPLCLWAFDAGVLGRSWYEGPAFLGALFKEIDRRKNIQLCTPMEYLAALPPGAPQRTTPGFSSSLENGYGEPLLDASNDWIYRHLFRSIQRMAELTDRFAGDSGLKERALNQAGRELLLAQSMDLSTALNPQYQGRINRAYAEKELEGALRNFTTIYEVLGSNHISTEWLTTLERRHNFLPCINHHVFGKKK